MSEPRKIELPELSLVVLVGASGSGKSTFASKHFKPTEVVSSDECRARIADDETDQAVTKEAFELLHEIVARRLRLGKLTVVDATSVRREDRASLIQLAKRAHALPIAIVLDVPPRVCQLHNTQRANRAFGPHVIESQCGELRRGLKRIDREGFKHVHVLGPDEVDSTIVVRVPLWNDKRHETGPFDVIGDVHGCADELEELLARLGYARDERGVHRHAQGRRVVFVGDLVDRGPRIVDSLTIAMDMVAAGAAFCVPGNHEHKLARHLRGKKVTVSHGLEASIKEIEALEPKWQHNLKERFLAFEDELVSHLVFDGGKLVVAHAGMKEEMIGRASGEIRSFALYGDTTGESDEYGLPVRRDWAASYKGRACVVYGHTPVARAEWLNNTIDIDQGCVFGGKLSALRWPEREVVSVDAKRVYYQPKRPLITQSGTASLQWQQDEVLDLADFLGKHVITTALDRNVTIRAEHAAAALEVLSRFAVDPRWLIYLPPTMSPCETSAREGFLEHPEDAIAHFKQSGVAEVVCEEKHMGSRAVLIVCRDERAGLESFGRSALGECYSRTGRPFFRREMRDALLARLSRSFVAGGLFEKLETSWIALDCEIMPWSLKAHELLRSQYAAVAASAEAALPLVEDALAKGAARGLELGDRLARVKRQRDNVARFREAYRSHCWEVSSLDDLAIAPFHVLATEGRTYEERDHVWHMETIASLVELDATLKITQWKLVTPLDEASVQDAIAWWTRLTDAGGEGMVVKPRSFVARSGARLAQPAVKCRGREYLRIIYGPDYDSPANLARLRQRGLGHKRSLALREFALGLEGIRRFVQKDPLRRVHECAFGVLALESEPVDPRL